MPADLNSDKISAECRNGILRITLAKAEHARAKKIEINL